LNRHGLESAASNVSRDDKYTYTLDTDFSEVGKMKHEMRWQIHTHSIAGTLHGETKKILKYWEECACHETREVVCASGCISNT